MNNLFTYIKAAQFFPKYAPLVKDWKKKLSGKNGRGNPMDFTDSDKSTILEGFKLMIKDLNRYCH